MADRIDTDASIPQQFRSGVRLRKGACKLCQHYLASHHGPGPEAPLERGR